MNYTLHQLQIFLKVTQTGSITKAAEELHLTQPAVSIQLKNLQDQFDIPLTEVIKRKLFITDFGMEIARAAEAILNEVYAINYKTLAYKGKMSGRLKISVVSTGKYIVPYLITDFMKTYGDIELILDVTNKTQVIKSLENNEIDFALLSVMPEKLMLGKIAMMNNELFLIANRDFETTGNEYDPHILESLPLIYRENGSATRQLMENFIEMSGLIVSKKIELTSNEAVKQAVLAGLGCSIMPLIGVKNELLNGSLKIVPVKGLPIVTVWNLVWMKQKKFSPVATAFRHYIMLHYEQIMKKHFSI